MPPVRILGLLSMIAIAGPAVAAADPIKVAIVPEVEVNLESARVDALAQDLAEALEAELEVDASGGLEVRRRLPPDGLPADCRATPACIADIAKRLDANQLLFVVMADTGGLQVDSTWIDVATNKQVQRPAIVVGPIPEAKARFVSAARSLLPDAPVRPKPKTVGELSTTTRPAVPRHFTRPAMITAGVAVVGAGVGVVFGMRTRSRYNDCEKITCSSDARDSIRNNGLVADAGFFLAAAGAVATGILYATSGKEAQIIVEPSPTGVALTAVGRF